MELAQVEDPDLTGQVVATRLDVPDTPGQDATEAVAKYIADHQLLIVLDNCEHLAEAAASLAEYLLAACPNLAVLATSREALGVEGELSWQVPPLSLPQAEPAPTASALAKSDAVKLFEQRAQLVRPSFRVTDENAAAVLAICQRLDGLPLAIELAAARMRMLSSAQLADRLDDIFAVLVGGARSAPPRHQALRATLDWSHDLLGDDERAVFRRLAAFSGGFTLPAAEWVAARGDIQPEAMLELLTRLADKSLLRVEHAHGGMRYHLLATIQDYAAERLAEAGESAQVRQAHREYVTDLVEHAAARIERVEEQAGPLELELDRLDIELPNIRRAFEHAQDCGDPAAALRIAAPLDRYAYLRGRYLQVRQWMDEAVACARTGQPSSGPRHCWAAAGWPCCSATTRPRSGGWRPRCGCTGSLTTRAASPARCRSWAAWPGSRAATPGRWNCMRRAWPSPRRPATGGRWPAPTATWPSCPGCSANSSQPPRKPRSRWPPSATSATWRGRPGP